MAATTIDTQHLDDDVTTPMVDAEAAQSAELFQALGNPSWLRILSTLNTCCVPVGPIAAVTGPRQSMASRHLLALHERSLVRAKRRGTYIVGCLASHRLRPVIDAARTLLEDRRRW